MSDSTNKQANKEIDQKRKLRFNGNHQQHENTSTTPLQ
jgi:hypothetical protein